MIKLPTWFPKDRTSACLAGILLAFIFAYVLALCKLCCVDEGHIYSFLIDDAMIGMRYAYNFAHGHGLVWNPGERIQGYTNLGWTLLSALIHYSGLPLNLNSLAIQLINGLLHLLLILYWFRVMRNSYGNLLALASAAIMAFNVSIFIHGLYGYETTLICLLCSIAFSWCILDGQNRLGITQVNAWAPLLTAICVLIREDSIVLFASAVLATLVGNYLVAVSKRKWIATVVSIFGGLAIISLMLLWQKLYYGNLLPNTFYLKCNPSITSIQCGLKYFMDFSLKDWQIAYLVGTICYIARGITDRQTWRAYVPLCLTVIPLWLYIIFVGGDCFGLGRFFVPLMPLMVVSSLVFLRDSLVEQPRSSTSETQISNALQQPKDRRWIAHLYAPLLAYTVLSFPFKMVTALNATKLLNMDTVAVLRTLKTIHLRSTSLIAVFRAGAVPYYLPEFSFHDLLGKCDPYISHLPVHVGQLTGHNKFDFQYSLGKLRPDVLITSHPLDKKFQAELTANSSPQNYLQSLFCNHDFQKYYFCQRVPVPINNPAAEHMWIFTRTTSPKAPVAF